MSAVAPTSTHSHLRQNPHTNSHPNAHTDEYASTTPTNTPPLPSDDAPNSIAEITETSPNGAKIERYINLSGDEDWFRFELAEASNINVQVTSLPADYDLYLYDAGGLLLEASERRGVRAERIIRKDQPAGYYYVQVVGYDGAWDAGNSYLLRFKVN